MSSTAPKIIFKHETNTSHINPYNATILHMWKANMDIQFIKNAIGDGVCVQLHDESRERDGRTTEMSLQGSL